MVNLEIIWAKLQKCWTRSPRIWVWDLKPSGRNKFDIIHKTSRLIGKNYVQIQVIGTQEKKLRLGLFTPRRLELLKHHPNSNWLCKQYPYKSAYVALRIIATTSGQFETPLAKEQKCWPVLTRIWVWNMKTSGKNSFYQTYKISRLIWKILIQIQVIGMQEKRMKLGLLRERS